MYTTTLALLCVGLAVMVQARQIIKGDYKATLQCPKDEIAVGICSSGHKRNCPEGVAQMLVCEDFLNRTVLPSIAMPQTNSYRRGRFEVQTCPANEFLWSRCSSGGKKDCLDGQAVNVVQCAAGYKVAPSSKAETLVGTYGQLLQCGPGKAIRRVCGGLGRNIDYCEDLIPDNKVLGAKIQGIVCEDVDVSGATSSQASIRRGDTYEARGAVPAERLFTAQSKSMDDYASPAPQRVQRNEYKPSFETQSKPMDDYAPPPPSVQSNQNIQAKDVSTPQANMRPNISNNTGTKTVEKSVPTERSSSGVALHFTSLGLTILAVLATLVVGLV